MPAVGNRYPLAIVLEAVDRASATMHKVERSLGRIGKVATKVGRGLTTGVTLPVVGIGVAATKMTADFEQGMSNVSTLIDTNVESLSDMGAEVLRIGKETPVAVEDLTSALFDVRSAGVSAADQFAVLEGSAQLAVAGLGSTKEAVDLVTSATNAFQLEGDDAAKVFDNIFKTTKFGKTTISELAQGFGAVAGTVAATGTPLDEYLASVSALTTTGLPAAQAHRQLRRVMSGLTRDTKQTRAVFQALGAKDLKDLIAKSGGFNNAIKAISKELGGNEAKLLNLVGSTEALNAVLGLTGAQAEAAETTLHAMRNESDALGTAFAKQNKTTTAALQRTKNALLAAAVSIGTSLAPHVERLAEMVANASTWFAELDESTKGWIMTAAGVAAVVGPVLLIFGKIATIVSVIGAPVAAVVALLATAAVMIISEWEYFEQFFDLLWKGVVAGFDWAWSKIKPTIDRIRDGVKVITDAHRATVNFFVDDDIGTVPLQRPTRRANPTAAPAPGGGSSSAAISVEFKNAPPGLRVDVDPASDADVDVSAGINMAPLL